MSERVMTILIAEDDDGHAELIQDHLQEAGIRNPIIRFQDGQEAWEFLSCTGAGPHRQQDVEYLLLLDIRMPRMDGIEVLRRVKASADLQHIPVMMLTTTDTPMRLRSVTGWAATSMWPSRWRSPGFRRRFGGSGCS